MIRLVPAIHVVAGFTKCECYSEDSYFSGKIGNSHGLHLGALWMTSSLKYQVCCSCFVYYLIFR